MVCSWWIICKSVTFLIKDVYVRMNTIYEFTYTHVCVYIYTYVYVYRHVSLYMYVHMYRFIFRYMYVCVCDVKWAGRLRKCLVCNQAYVYM